MDKKTSSWVDYKDLKTRVNVLDVLRHYNVELRSENQRQFYGTCPLPGHAGDRDNVSSFSVSSEKNAWRCLSHCGSGNVIDLFARLSGRDPSDKRDFREAALEMQEIFLPEKGSSPPPEHPKPAGSIPPILEPNPVLDFTLQVKPDIPFLMEEKKFDPDFLNGLGIGWVGKGMFSGRVAIPIHNAEGKLVAYAGRGLKDTDIRKRGKYLFPRAFHKSLELFNQHRAAALVEQWKGIVVVEGFFGALRWHQAGVPAVALMGCEISRSQIRRLSALTDRIWLMLDRDDAGREAQEKATVALARHVFVRMMPYPDGPGSEPEDFAPEELLSLIRE